MIEKINQCNNKSKSWSRFHLAYNKYHSSVLCHGQTKESIQRHNFLHIVRTSSKSIKDKPLMCQDNWKTVDTLIWWNYDE